MKLLVDMNLSPAGSSGLRVTGPETKICNRWLHSASTWLSIPAWDRCADSSLTLDDFKHDRVYVGVDLAERDDIAAVALVFRRDDLIYQEQELLKYFKSCLRPFGRSRIYRRSPVAMCRECHLTHSLSRKESNESSD